MGRHQIQDVAKSRFRKFSENEKIKKYSWLDQILAEMLEGDNYVKYQSDFIYIFLSSFRSKRFRKRSGNCSYFVKFLEEIITRVAIEPCDFVIIFLPFFE